MIFVPYSTALTLSRPPIVCYASLMLCVAVYSLQLSTPITETLLYYPDSWNPVSMVTASFAHADFAHLFGNLIFFMAFAPALEILIGSWLRFVWIMIFISFVVGVCYSLSIVIGGAPAIPTLGFSGVVMGMIGLSAYLMPRARIRVFCWFILFWKTMFIPAWIMAIIYIGLDAWTMLAESDFGGVNVVAHVAGGLAGYLYGVLWLEERREEISDELTEEVEAMRVEQRYGKTRAQAHRYIKATDPIVAEKKRTLDYDKFMGQVYQMVKTHRDSEAVLELLNKYDLDSLYTELEIVFERANEWGPSRTLLCLGRLIIQILDNEKRYGRAIVFIEKCQAVSAQFILPDVSRTLFYAQMSIDTGKPEVARGLLANSAKRYGALLNHEQCNHLYQKAR